MERRIVVEFKCQNQKCGKHVRRDYPAVSKSIVMGEATLSCPVCNSVQSTGFGEPSKGFVLDSGVWREA